jgi:membrane protease YdiL (CAAX protease family)
VTRFVGVHWAVASPPLKRGHHRKARCSPETMRSVQPFFRRHPLTSAVLIAIVTKGGLTATAIAVAVLLGGIDTLARAAVAIMLLGLIPIALYALTRRTGMAEAVGFTGPRKWVQPWLAWPPALFALVNAAGLWDDNLSLPADLTPFYNAAVQSISVPLIEEFAFRGLILAVLLAQRHETSWDFRRAVLISSALFGVWHLPTIAYNPISGSANVVYAAFAGVAFAAVVVRTRTIWPVLVIHMLIVLTSVAGGILRSGEAVAAGTLITAEQAWASGMRSIAATLPLLLYGMWLLRKPIQMAPDTPEKSRNHVHPAS